MINNQKKFRYRNSFAGDAGGATAPPEEGAARRWRGPKMARADLPAARLRTGAQGIARMSGARAAAAAATELRGAGPGIYSPAKPARAAQ